ncbi:MAG: YraN family protein [candidate division WOR-3 bacterium]
MNKRKKGFEIENKVCEYLKSKGYEIIERNYYCGKYGEIDIIAKKENFVVFIEVRSLNKIEHYYTISYKKLKRLEDCINYYVSEKKIENYRFELVIFNKGKILHLNKDMF